MQGMTTRIRTNLEQRREQRRMVRDFHAASPRMQEEIFEVLRRSDTERV